MLQKQILTLGMLSLSLLLGCTSKTPRESLSTRQDLSGKSLVTRGVVVDENGVCRAGYVFRAQTDGRLPKIRSWVDDDGIVSLEINGELVRSSENADQILLFHNKIDEEKVESEKVDLATLTELRNSELGKTEGREPSKMDENAR